jgi:ribosomal protein S18 acetylase RimI-like enzyme
VPPLLGRDYQASISSALHRLQLHGCSGLLCVAATLVEVEIRELVSGRGDLLLALFDAVVPKSATAQADNVDEAEAFLRDPSSFAFGAYIDGAPVGLAWGIQMRSPSGRLTTYIHELDVHENWRRHGVGSALVTEAMTLARRRGSTKLWLSTGGHNEIAQALYEALGGDRKPLGDVNYWWDLA